MELTQAERDAIRDTAAWMAEHPNELTKCFYALFFARHPEAADLFGRHSQADQARMLHETLVAALDHLEDALWLESYLDALGGRHASYEVTEPMYEWFTVCLMETFAELMKDRWDEDHVSAWRKVLDAVCAGMIAGD